MYIKANYLIISTILIGIINIAGTDLKAYQNAPRPANNDFAPSVSPDGSQIVFHSFRNGFSDIYKMNIDGSIQTRLTSSQAHDRNPKWSPDGSKIVYYSNRDGNNDLFIMDTDGSNQVIISTSDSNETSPVWSFDSNKILYVSKQTGINQIWSMHKDGSNNKQITRSKDPKSNPSYSPDDSKIAYVSSKSGFQEIYLINANGSGEKKLTYINSEKADRSIDGLSWTPDGKRITFQANLGKFGRFWFRYNVYTMNPDGADLKRIVGVNGVMEESTWSPDGKKIIFRSQLNGGNDIFSINIDGSELNNLTRTSEESDYPNWADNGRKIVYQSTRDGNPEIYIMNSDGSNKINLTNNEAPDRTPSLSHDMKTIVFVSYRDNDYGDLYTIDIDGSTLKKISKNDQFTGLDAIPWSLAISPDKKKIILGMVGVRGGDSRNTHWGIHSIDSGGNNFKRLADKGPGEFSAGPAVSPDGKEILYYSNKNSNYEIYKMDINGKNLVNLTQNQGLDFNSSWSHDGKKIYFLSNRNKGVRELFVMEKDGSNVKKITDNIGQISSATVSPDGQKILFRSNREKNWHIYTIDVDGKNLMKLTGNNN